MKSILLIVALVLTGVHYNADAGELRAFGGLYAFDDNATKLDYVGLSPFGYFGLKWVEPVGERVHINFGLKHQSSMAFRERGGGFNGVFGELEVKLW